MGKQVELGGGHQVELGSWWGSVEPGVWWRSVELNVAGHWAGHRAGYWRILVTAPVNKFCCPRLSRSADLHTAACYMFIVTEHAGGENSGTGVVVVTHTAS